MKTLFVGDLHGIKEIVYKVSKSNYPDRVVFVGDYLDSFNRSFDDQIQTLQTVLLLCQEQPEKFIGLLGNHEWSYLNPMMQCSGYSFAVQAHIIHLKNLMLKILKPFVYVDEWLVSHAGVSQTTLDYLEYDLPTYLQKQEFFQIGRSRGGWSPTGGLYWCDWKHDFEPIKGINQIMGHTHYKHDGFLRTKDTTKSINYCIDCNSDNLAENIFLVLDNGIPKTISYDYL